MATFGAAHRQGLNNQSEHVEKPRTSQKIAQNASRLLLLHHSFPLLPVAILLLNPFVGCPQAGVQWRVRLPLKNLLNERIVAVATSHPAGSAQFVLTIELYPRDFLHLRNKVVNGNKLAGTKVYRRGDKVVAVRDHVNALHAIINIHEAARLETIAPNLDSQIVLIDRLNHLAANRGRGLFTSAIPGPVRAVNIVKAGDEGLHAPFRPVFLAEYFTHQFFPAIAAL